MKHITNFQMHVLCYVIYDAIFFRMAGYGLGFHAPNIFIYTGSKNTNTRICTENVYIKGKIERIL